MGGINRLLRNPGVILALSCMGWYVIIELYLFALSSTGIAFMEYLMPPYKENIENYSLGGRNQTWDNRSIADQLYHKVRVYCLLHLTNDHERRKAKHIRRTWGARCNKIHFSEASSVAKAYQHIDKTQYSDLDWLLHVHVDSYVIVENLRYTLAVYSPDQMVYFSAFHAAYPYAHVSLRNSTDYIFSRNALQYLLETPGCLGSQFSVCLSHMIEGPNEQLFPFQVPAETIPFTLRTSFWMWPYIYRKTYTKQDFNIIKKPPILFPYSSANQFHLLEFLLYHLRPYGYVHGMPGLAEEIPAVSANDTVSKQLRKRVRILCILLTHPHNYEQMVRTIRRTWGRHCNKLIAFSSRVQESLPGVQTVALNVSEGYDLLWGKTKAAFKHVYAHHLDEADWFYKADDDTYAIMDNMRFMLQHHRPEQPIYFGCKFKLPMEPAYMSGGSGYVLSREALRRLIECGLKTSRCTAGPLGTEDFEMGSCLSKCNVSAGDSRDSFGRHRFLPLGLRHHMIPGALDRSSWLHKYSYYTFKEGMECCSDYVIAMHYIIYYEMLIYEYILYNMRPYGIIMYHEAPDNNSIYV